MKLLQLNQLLSAVMLCFISLGSFASQSSVANKFYLGVDWQVATLHYDESHKGIIINNYRYMLGNGDSSTGGMGSFGGRVGYRWNTIGVEAGYNSGKSSISTAGNAYYSGYGIYGKNNNIYIDIYKFLPIYSFFELKAMLGMGRVNSRLYGSGYYWTYPSSKIYSSESISSNKIKPRFGAGVQFNLYGRISMDLMYKYQGGNDLYKNSQSLGLGLNYHFQIK